MIVGTALLCLSLNVYHEARGELIPGQYAVALVTMNRANWKRNLVCNETFKPGQFSWANGKVTQVKGGWQISQSVIPKEKQAWELAKTIAQTTLKGKMADFTWGANYYHAQTVRPHWSRGTKPVKVVGSHRFYALQYKS